MKPFVAWGAGPRAVQYLILGAEPGPHYTAVTWCVWKMFMKSRCPS